MKNRGTIAGHKLSSWLEPCNGVSNSNSYGMPDFQRRSYQGDYHTEETATMSKYVDELHNHEDATSLKDGILLFLGLILLLGFAGILFWSAF